ncbi:trehalose operon repressor [Paenibacillus sp. UMB4589-SE434]|uniref:trehalose operon repressor n=1 Tax=Paenibacillus sp. UMB4589-SE434 TaxID=3046314 RepID=UPI00254EFFCD|nr:trehalose operon repressor [Paenibacillus sp. UMB4589-SE434]MDK8181917.1 trehalose operon repressor [Paenibacillus sp. UMB4589-SE434]
MAGTRDDVVSKYEHIMDEIIQHIENGKWKDGVKIPSETELMESYAASRGTVRKAVDLLQERGYVQKIHGKGVYVTRKKNIELSFGGIVSFKEANERLKRGFTTHVKEILHLKADRETAKRLGVKSKTDLHLIKRVRRTENENVILDINYFVTDMISGLTKEIAEDSIYAYIEQQLRLQISYAHRVIEVQPCGDDDRRYLDLNGTDYVVVVKNFTYLYDGTQFEYTESRHRLDKFYFSDVARRM